MAFLHDINEREWVQNVRQLLQQSRAQKGAYRYTQPHPGAVGLQAPFNSALHAMIYRWFDGEMASDELKSATAKQIQDGFDAGMIPHHTYWQENETRWSQPDRSDIATIPMLSYATVQVYHLTGDYNLIERMYPRLVAYHEWFDHRRDPDADELISSIHPSETVLAKVLGRDFDNIQTVEGHIREFQGNTSALMETGSFAGEYLATNAMRAAALDALAHIAEDMGLRDEKDRWKRRADAVREAVSGLMQQRITALAGKANLPMETDETLLLTTLFCGSPTPEQAAELVALIPRDSAFGVAYPLEQETRISMTLNWLVYIGLRRYGFKELALELTEKSMRLVQQSGFYEFYDARTGAGIGASNYGAAGLVIDMLFREKQSQLPRPKCLQEVE